MKFYTHNIVFGDVAVPLRCYIPDVCGDCFNPDHRPAVIIFPGGAYSFTYSGEAEPIALKYAADGICAFVLDYSCAPHRFPLPQLQAFSAIRYVREHAEELGINPHNIAASGFSAGGHLCATTGTLWNKDAFWRECKEYKMLDGVEKELYRPDKLILCYPVIKSDTEHHHHGCFENLLGEDNVEREELMTLLGTDRQVDDKTPPSFLWHTAGDTCVPVINSIDFAAALAVHGTPIEMHIYPHGDHGLCLGTGVTSEFPFDRPDDVSVWIDLAIRFAHDEKVLT
ncbi:MAG: alpha/beta hydrolase [Clostridia bacterium]|nr:alpha/beta hydrolase [Clostridia bacterium]